MTIDELLQKKSELTADITKLLITFTQRTGVSVEYLAANLDMLYTINSNGGCEKHVNYDITIELDI